MTTRRAINHCYVRLACHWFCCWLLISNPTTRAVWWAEIMFWAGAFTAVEWVYLVVKFWFQFIPTAEQRRAAANFCATVARAETKTNSGNTGDK